MLRVVAPEALDHLAPQDPQALRSRRDLVRVHQVMGTRACLQRAWQVLVPPQRTGARLKVLELGAGDGSLLLGVARTLSPRWPQVQLTLLDRLDIVGPEVRQGFAALGWTVHPQTVDALAWAAAPQDGRHWDLISTALFLHHFDGEALRRLLAAVAARCDRFIAFEPARSRVALWGSHLVGLLGTNAVTRADAVLSVKAGFRGREIGAHWPPGDGAWQLHEAPAGPFGHCFSARRVEPAR